MDIIRLVLCETPDEPSKGVELENKQSLLRLALRMCRKYKLIKDRVTVLSPTDVLQVVQLCLARVHKQMGKGFQADAASIFTLAQSVCVTRMKRAIRDIHCLLQNALSSSDKDAVDNKSEATIDNIANVQKTPSTPGLQTSGGDLEELSDNVLQEYDKFMVGSNHIDAVEVLKTFLSELLNPQSDIHADLSSVELEVDTVPRDPLQELAVKLLTHGRITKEDACTDPDLIQSCLTVCVIDSSAVQSFHLQRSDEEDDCNKSVSEDGTEKDSHSTEYDLSKELLHELFLSYLQLLVNTRSELAFAHIFNTPDRGLTHKAFTLLKHQAQRKNMSLYQVAMSVITQLRLGGRGYAPDANNGLLEYVKGLGLLSDLMNKLQQLLEDTQCVRSSVFRVVGTIRKNLIGCQSQRYLREAVEQTAGQIQRDLEHVLSELQLTSTLISPDKPASEGGSLTSRGPRRVLLHYLDRCAVSLWEATHSPHHTWLHDVPYGPHTPSRFPCVLTQFKSPAISAMSSPSKGKEGKKDPGHRKRKMAVSTNLMPDNMDVPLLQRCAKNLRDTVIVLPSKTIVHPAESKLSCGVLDSDPYDKENNKPLSSPDKKKKKKTTKSTARSNPNTAVILKAAVISGEQEKDDMQVSGSQPSKPPAKPGKKCRRRLLPPPGKDQRSITSFFRV